VSLVVAILELTYTGLIGSEFELVNMYRGRRVWFGVGRGKYGKTGKRI
jgi:hypothetical protein